MRTRTLASICIVAIAVALAVALLDLSGSNQDDKPAESLELNQTQSSIQRTNPVAEASEQARVADAIPAAPPNDRSASSQSHPDVFTPGMGARSLFNREKRDPAWADGMEERLNDWFSAAPGFMPSSTSTECLASACRVQFTFPDDDIIDFSWVDSYLDPFVIDPLLAELFEDLSERNYQLGIVRTKEGRKRVDFYVRIDR
jgi:hypothetical protein